MKSNIRLMNTSLLTYRMVFALLLVVVLQACNQSETSKKQKEAPLAIAEIEQEIKNYISLKTQENGGFFPVKDENHDLKMKLVRVHTEYLSNLGPHSHFACVDLVDESGDVYDVDFFMEGTPGEMDITQTSVHKLNGKPYYSWKQNTDKTWNKMPLEQSDNSLLGVKEGKDSFEFYYIITLPTLTEAAEIWIPMALSDAFQKVKILEKKSPVPSKVLKDPANKNEVLYLMLGPEHSGQQISISYAVTRSEKGPYAEALPNPSVYLTGNKLMPTGGRFEEIAKEALGEKIKESKLVQARALYDYIIETMRYMKFGDFGRGDSNYACDAKTGNCTDFHSYFISLARSVGIPARFGIGASIPSDRNEGGMDGYHCWAEFYADGKWWPVDISEANKYTALATYYFGRHPANRIEFTRGRDLELNPGPTAGPINFLVFPYLEMGGKEIKAPTTFTFQRKS